MFRRSKPKQHTAVMPAAPNPQLDAARDYIKELLRKGHEKADAFINNSQAPAAQP